MRNQITSVAVALLVMAGVDARKQLIDANENRLQGRSMTPKVGSATCEDKCLFGKNDGTEKTYWCFAFTEPILTLGWEYNQDANTSTESTPLKHLRFDLIYYLDIHLQLTSTLDIFRLYYNQFMFELSKIKYKFEYGTIINEKWQYCPHLAYNRSAIGFKSTYRQEFMNCDKVIIKNLWDTNGVWRGKYAKIFEECERSQKDSATGEDPQVTATLWEKDLDSYPAVVEKIFAGSVDPESTTHCKTIPGFPTSSAGYENGEMIEGDSGLMIQVYAMAFNFLESMQNVSYKGTNRDYSVINMLQ